MAPEEGIPRLELGWTTLKKKFEVGTFSFLYVNIIFPYMLNAPKTGLVRPKGPLVFFTIFPEKVNLQGYMC
jgi:hypothetical protein